MDLERLMCCCW